MSSLPLSVDVIESELRGVHEVVGKWRSLLEAGIPGINGLPTTEENTEKVVRQLIGEMLYVAGRCQNMALILAER